jgi:hypothetical protein
LSISENFLYFQEFFQKSGKSIKYQENIIGKEVVLSKIPRIFSISKNFLNFQKYEKPIKYQENIIGKKVAISKISKIFQEFREFETSQIVINRILGKKRKEK